MAVAGLPVGGKEAGLGQGGELFDVEDLVAEAGVQRLHPGVLPGRCGIDVGGGGGAGLAPLAQHAGGQLGAVVGPEVLGSPALGH